jgi:hypothetical protein
VYIHIYYLLTSLEAKGDTILEMDRLRFAHLVPFRVTRLGEFSPIGRLFPLDRVLKISEVAHIFGIGTFLP